MAPGGHSGLGSDAVVRVRTAAGRVVGGGFLIAPDVVATCAHVVADALGTSAYSPDPPAGRVRLDFPFADPAPVDAVIERWLPIDDEGTGDVALLRIGTRPFGVRMPPLRRIDRLWGHAFRAVGFPDGAWDGIWTTGQIRAGQGTGWCQLQGAPGEPRIEGGFSGAPVWEEETGAVVGMTVAADLEDTTTTAYVIPIDQVLGLDPELLPSPYRGLAPFTEEHAALFFGRDADIDSLVTAVERHPVVAVAGRSGVGKSSLVRAGLLPRLRAAGAVIVEVKPIPGEPLPEPSGDTRQVLLVDQFEELAAIDPDAAHELLSLIVEHTARNPATRAVLTVRWAAFDQLATSDLVDTLAAGTFFVGAMNRTALREAIVSPAERAPGLVFEDGLVDRVLDDAGTEPGRLPLVAALLANLWERREGGALTMRGYEDAGGVAGAVAQRAERVTEALADEDRIRRLFTALARPDQDGRFVRRPGATASLPPDLRGLVAPLVAGRLLVEGPDTIELAHQALIDRWPRLQGWLADDRNFVTWRAFLDAARERWDASGHDDGALLRGTALAAANDWLLARGSDVPAADREFVRRSGLRQRRDVRRWRMVTAVLAVLVLLAGLFAAVAVDRGNAVADQLRLANAEVMAQTALENLPSAPVTASALALAAYRSDPENDAARTALARLATGMQSVDAVYADITEEPLNDVKASGDGQTLLAANQNQAVVVLDALGAAPTYWELPGYPGKGNWYGLSGDGRSLAALDGEGRVLLWDVAGRSGPTVINKDLGPALRRSLQFSPDSGRLGWITPLPDGTHRLVIWDLRAAAPSPTALPITDPQIHGASLTADPASVVLLERDGVTVRSITDGQVRARLPDTGTGAGSSSIWVSCAAGAVAVHDTATGQELQRVQRLTKDCPDAIMQNELTDDGEFLLEQRSKADERDLDLWRLTSLRTGKAYELLAPPRDSEADLQGPEPDQRPVAFQTMVALAGDRPVVYQIRGRSVLRLHADPADASSNGPLLTADGRYEVSAEPGGIVAVDAATRTPAGVLPVTDLPGSGGRHILHTADSLAVITTAADHLSYAEYAVPGLVSTTQLTLPRQPGQIPSDSVRVKVLGDRVAILHGGVLAAWDRRTGAPVGKPILLAADDPGWAQQPEGRDMELRPGPAWQVGVLGPAGGITLWDMATGTRVGEPGIGSVHLTFHPDGRYLVADRPDLSLQAWDIDRDRPAGPPFSTSGIVVTLGFSPDGLLASFHPVDSVQGRPDTAKGLRVVLHNALTGREQGRITLPPGMVPEAELLDGRLRLPGEGGRRPSMVPLDVREWVADLCRLTDRPFTGAEQDLIPAGTTLDRPCAG